MKTTLLTQEVSCLWSEHEWDGGEVAVADRQQAEKGDVVTLVKKYHLEIDSSSNTSAPQLIAMIEMKSISIVCIGNFCLPDCMESELKSSLYTHMYVVVCWGSLFTQNIFNFPTFYNLAFQVLCSVEATINS